MKLATSIYIREAAKKKNFLVARPVSPHPPPSPLLVGPLKKNLFFAAYLSLLEPQSLSCLVDGPAAAVLAAQVHDIRLGVQRAGQVSGREPPGDHLLQNI